MTRVVAFSISRPPLLPKAPNGRTIPQEQYHMHLAVKCSQSAPQSKCKQSTPTSIITSTSTTRRALLQSAGLLGLASLLPPYLSPSLAAVSAPSVENTSSSWQIQKDYVFDSKSGSFLPPSSLDDILRTRTGSLFDRCIIAGEIHNNTFTHAAQLAVIDSARRLDDERPLIIGFEQFYATHTKFLMQFTNREISLDQLLEATDWENRWRFDANLYRPIFDYCQSHNILMVGLNIPSSITSFVSKNGIHALPSHIQDQLPTNMDFNNTQHFTHFANIMMKTAPQHFGTTPSDDPETVVAMIRKFYQAQVLWEEWMSHIAARYLNALPTHRLVTLIGAGHVEERTGFPDRLEKRVRERPLTIVPRPVAWVPSQDDGYSVPDIICPEKNIADLVWYTRC